MGGNSPVKVIMQEIKKNASQQPNSQLSLTAAVCFCQLFKVELSPEKADAEISTCSQRLEARALRNTLHVLRGWANQREGLKVDSSAMRDSGLALLTARSAFQSRHVPHRRIIGRVTGRRPVVQTLLVCRCYAFGSCTNQNPVKCPVTTLNKNTSTTPTQSWEQNTLLL